MLEEINGRRRAVLGGLVALCAAGGALGPRPARAATDPRRLAQRFGEARAGLVVGHRAADGTLRLAASGHSAPGVALAPHMGLAVGSLTKTFTAALVFRLQEQRRLATHDTLRRWLPQWVGEQVPGEATLAQLLSHTSGIGGPPLPDTEQGILDLHVGAGDQGVRWLIERAGRPAFAPGRGYAYSNLGYVLLGLVIERAGGRRYHEQLREEILDPLGLSSAFVQEFEPARGEVAGTWVLLDQPQPRAPAGLMQLSWSAGALVANGRDVLTWFDALCTGRVLSPESLGQMLTVPSRGQPSSPADAGPRMAHGILRGQLGGVNCLVHNGSTLGYHCVAAHLTDTGDTCFMASNSSFDPWQDAASRRSLFERLVREVAGDADPAG